MSSENSSVFQTQNDSAEVFFTLEGKILSGRRGQYTITRQLQADPGVRIYSGTELHDHTPVLIKEYYFFWWTASDIQRIEAELEQLETIDFHSGGVQDFRLLTPQDAFASMKDQRCYLILRPPQQAGRSLKNYLELQERLPAATVRYLLSQAFQSLWFLHNQMIDFANGDTQKGTAHGNLSLNSLWIVPDSNAQLQVYLQDLELWEGVVRPGKNAIAKLSLNDQKQQDLKSLGTIAAQLLVGELNPPEHWNPTEHSDWAELGDQALKQFVLQLMGLEFPIVPTAKFARTQLLGLPVAVEKPPSSEHVTEDEGIELGQADKPPFYFKLAFAVTFTALMINFGLLAAKVTPIKLSLFQNMIQNKR